MTQTAERTVRPVDVKRNQKSQGKINVMENIESVHSNVQSSRQEALLYVFEDNEAVIKMIFKGWSPTMRHVSRTHRVALDWWPGRWGPQGRPITGGAGLARVPNLRVCKHQRTLVGTCRGERAT